MKIQIEQLIEDIKANYSAPNNFIDPNSDIAKRMKEDFNNNISYRVGKKYIKIMTKGSIWGFVVNTDDDAKFRKGDILKAAGPTPARNASRGNIIEGGYSICWTGPHYMR